MKWFKCCHCGEVKVEADFYNDKSRPNGKKPRCKPCDKLSLNRERRRAYEKEYRQANPGRRAAIVRKSMAGNIAHHQQRRREYLATPKGRAAYRAQSQTRRARMKAAFVAPVSHAALYVQQMGRCYICDKRGYFSDQELDHVMPLARGGKHEPDNCKMACRHCNRSKGAKLLEELTYQVV